MLNVWKKLRLSVCLWKGKVTLMWQEESLEIQKPNFRGKADSGCCEHWVSEARLGFWDGMGGSSGSGWERREKKWDRIRNTSQGSQCDGLRWQQEWMKEDQGVYTWLYLPLALTAADDQSVCGIVSSMSQAAKFQIEVLGTSAELLWIPGLKVG